MFEDFSWSLSFKISRFIFDFALPHLLQEIFNLLISLPLWPGSNKEPSIVMLVDFLRLSSELSLWWRVSLRTSGLTGASDASDRNISLELVVVWGWLDATVMLMSSIESASRGFSTVFIPFDAVFSITCQLSSLNLTADVSSSSNDDESELELFVIFVLFWLLAQPLGPGCPSKMLWRFSEISIISSSEQSQSSRCGALLDGGNPMLLDGGEWNTLAFAADDESRRGLL